MHSHAEARMAVRTAWLAILAAAWLAVLGAAARAQAVAGEAPSEGQVARALKTVGADPNLATEETRRVPRFFDAERPERKRREFSWLRDLFSFIGQTSRVLMWVLGIIVAAVIVGLLVRLAARRGPGRAGAAPSLAPTHVRELDVRPESLPEHVGPSALALWEQGEPRAALVLLYRGLVSRLIHVHGVPIRQSTTEAGCTELARGHLSVDAAAYVQQLVRCWQRSVYGGLLPEEASFRALCASFDATLAARTSLGKRAA